MSELLVEIALRFAKVVAATVLGLVIYVALTGPIGAPGSAELALLSWLVGAASLLLIESSPL